MNSVTIDSVSGLTAGLVTTLTTHPLDLIKVRLQLADSARSHPLKAVLSHISHTAALTNHSLIKELYKGVTPNIIGNVSGWSLYFTLYEQLKDLHPQSSSSNTFKYFSSSTISGLITSLITNPVWVLKTRMISVNNSYSSTADAIVKIWKNEGIHTFWRGSVPSLFLVFQNSLQFTFYDHLKSLLFLESYRSKHTVNDIQFYFIASSVSKFCSMLVMYPFQVLRSNLQKVDSHSIWSELQGLYRTNGFYRGFTISVFKVLPATSITFVTYESMKIWLTRISEKQL